MSDIKKSKYKSARVLYIAGGFISCGLGTAGIFLPVLPTVPFYLLAAYCFAKGSPKHEQWLRGTRIFKKRVYFFEKYKVMTLRSMISMLICVSLVLAFTSLFADNIAVSIALPLLSICKYLYFILKVKPVTKAELERLRILDAEGLRA